MAWSIGWLPTPQPSPSRRAKPSTRRPLEALHYTYAEVDTVLLLVPVGVTIYWFVRRRPWRGDTPDPTTFRLLTVGGLAAVLTQTGFLENPFSPFFALAWRWRTWRWWREGLPW